MEKSVLLGAIAKLVAEDALNDKNDAFSSIINEEPTYPLLEQDDEDLTFFAMQRRQLQHGANNPSPSMKVSTQQKSPTKQPSSRSKQPTELNLLNKFNQEEFESHMHITKMTFLKIFQQIRGILENANFLISMPQTVFSLALWKLATDDPLQEIERKFHIPVYESNTIIQQFWRIVSDKHRNIIKWPYSKGQSRSDLPILLGFDNLLGVIALKRWHIFFSGLNEQMPVMLQIICDINDRIIDCHVELEKDYDFESSPIVKTLQDARATPPRSYLIGRNCFPLKRYLVCPYTKDCPELNSDDVGEFNSKLEEPIRIGENTLNALALRFNAMYAMEAKDLEEVRKITLSVCVLHNLCQVAGDDYVQRHRGTMKFNWANADSSQLHRYGSESDEEGLRHRQSLMRQLLK